MKKIQTKDFETYTLLFIEVEGSKYGVKIPKEAIDNMFEYHAKQIKKVIAKYIFNKHKIIVDHFIPHFSMLFNLEFNKQLISKNITENQLIDQMTKDGTLEYLNIIPVYLYKKDFYGQ